MQVTTVGAGRVGVYTAHSFAYIAPELACVDNRTEAKLLDARNALEPGSVEGSRLAYMGVGR